MAGVAEPERAYPTLTVDHVQTIDELGEVLRQLRRRYARRHNTPELTVRELARRSGYAYGVISEYLSGKTLAPTDRFDVLIRLLGASATEQRTLATARDRVDEQRRARPAVFVPRELPPDVPGFTGRRKELAELDLRLGWTGESEGVALISALAGTAGVGKTALAVHWAHRVGADFPDGCLYVDLRGYDPEQPVAPTEALAGFLRSLGVNGPDIPPTEAERAARYRTSLADRRMLVLLDNARGTDQVRPLLPGGSGCAALVTSRDALTGLIARHGAYRINLDPLTRDEALELLGVLLGERATDDPDAVRGLADRCAGLPLMLRLVAELAGARRQATLAELDTELADVRERLRRLDAGGEPRSASRAVFSWSYENLTAATALAFRLFGLFPGHELDAYALAALAGTDLDHARGCLQDLATAHLAQVVSPGRYGMHDLLRAYAAELAANDPETDRRAALARLLDQQLHTCSVAMDLVAPFDRDRRPKIPDPRLPTPLLANAESAIDWLDTERPTLIATALHVADEERATHAGQLAAILLRYLDTGAHYHDAELLYAHAVATAARADKAHALISLGIVCWRLGRYQEAATHHERALDLARETGDETELGRALLGLGIVYWHLGRTAQTLDCGQQALELYREIGDRLGQARVLGNLGNVHSQLGNYPAALNHHKRALDLFREVGDPGGAGNEMGGLGSVLERLGRFPEALDHLQEALAFARQAGYRECEASALGALGIVYRRLGRLTEAFSHHQQALDLIRKIGDRTAEGYALGQLGTVYERLGRLAQAVDHHREALGIAGEIGDDHLAAELRNRLGDTLRSGSRPKKALRSYRQALTKTGKNGNRYERARAYHGIARSLTAIDSQGAAQPHWERALRLYARLGVPEADEIRAELVQPPDTQATRPRSSR
jgi:tetratricopeptide (TPR) repeat protein/transcriptional regulator with XRE-family HTH domain